MASLAALALTPAQRLDKLRALKPTYGAEQSTRILIAVLKCLEDTAEKGVVKQVFDRIARKGIEGLANAAHAVILFCIFEALCTGPEAVPPLIDRFSRMLRGLEARFDYLPRHCGSNNELYNHLYGLFAVCVIGDEAVTLADLARLLRHAEGDDAILRGFDSWMQASEVVLKHGREAPFHDTVRDAVGQFLGKAPEPQPHVLLSVMLAVEKFGTHLDVANFLAGFGVAIDKDPAKLPVVSQTAPMPVPNGQESVQDQPKTLQEAEQQQAPSSPAAAKSMKAEEGQQPQQGLADFWAAFNTNGEQQQQSTAQPPQPSTPKRRAPRKQPSSSSSSTGRASFSQPTSARSSTRRCSSRAVKYEPLSDDEEADDPDDEDFVI